MAMQGYGTTGFDPNLPPEVSSEQQRIARQQAIAEAMLQRGLTPIQQQGAPIHFTQGLAQLFNAYAGRRGLDEASKAQGALGQQYQKGLADEVARIAALRQGETIQPDPQEFEQAADQGTPVPQPGNTGDPRAAVQAALTSQYAPVREMGKLDFQADLKSKEAAQARLARLEERKLILESQEREAGLDRESKERIAADKNDILLEIAELRRQVTNAGRSPYFTPIDTPSGVLSFNNREGSATPLLVNGQPVVRSRDDPNLQGRIAGAKKTGEAQATRAFNMQGIGGVIKKAEELLTGKQTPTQSGAGSIVDSVAGFFGYSPPGAKEAAALKTAAGALTSKMPRMEGPQSNLDVDLYQKMAADVGNEKLPIEQRISALQVVKNLWLKYETQNPDAFEPSAQGAGPKKIASDAEYNALPSGAEFIAPDGSTRRKP